MRFGWLDTIVPVGPGALVDRDRYILRRTLKYLFDAQRMLSELGKGDDASRAMGRLIAGAEELCQAKLSGQVPPRLRSTE